MRVSVGGASSEIEAEAQKKLINEKEIKALLEGEPSKSDLMRAKSRMNELLGFYDRIIRSVHATINTVNGKHQLSHKQKQDLYIKNQEKDLAQAKREKSKFRRYLKSINEKLADIS
jgi:hypothetical protein